MKATIQTTVGLLDVEMTFMPADPDSGFLQPYVDDWSATYAGSSAPLTLDDADAIAGDEFSRIIREYISQLSEQAAIAQAYNRGEEWD